MIEVEKTIFYKSTCDCGSCHDLYQTTYIKEFAACRRTINVNYSKLKGLIPNPSRLVGRFYISLPRLLFKVKYNHTDKDGIGLSNYNVGFNSLALYVCVLDESGIYSLPLGNIKLNTSICLEGFLLDKKSPNESYKDLVLKNAVSYFWQSEFNLGYNENVIAQIIPRRLSYNEWKTNYEWKTNLSNLEFWEKKTKEDLNWIPSINELIKTPVTLQTFLDD